MDRRNRRVPLKDRVATIFGLILGGMFAPPAAAAIVHASGVTSVTVQVLLASAIGAVIALTGYLVDKWRTKSNEK